MRLLALFALPLFALYACDPGTHINGHVTAPDQCAMDKAQPVEGATVKLKCEDGESALGKTGADGRFTYSKLGSLSGSCVIHVSADGYLPRQYRVEHVCATGLVGGHCMFVNLEPVLLRASAAPVTTATH